MTKLRKASISTSIALIVMLTCMLFQGTSALAARSAATSPTLSVSSNLANRRYVASGDRAYDLGSEDGRYPAMGFHTRGEMGGIWTPPIKLLDGIWFGINSKWIGPARSEEHTSELQSRFDLVCRLLLEKKKKTAKAYTR